MAFFMRTSSKISSTGATMNNISSKRSPLIRAMASSTDEQQQITTDVKPLENAGPEPKRFGIADGQLTNIARASLPALLRFGSGAFVSGYKSSLDDNDGKYSIATVSGKKVQESSKVAEFKRPVKTLELYEFEACPYCKKVREAISILDLDVLVYPCPKDGATWRPQAIELGGKKQFPLLVDPNTEKKLYESDDIIRYLFQEYGDGEVPLLLRLGAFTNTTCMMASMVRVDRGRAYRKSKLPEQALVLWGYEASPFVKVVREVLAELELKYYYRNVARGSPKRQELLDMRGTFQVPYLEDPNTGVYMFESSAIIKYLEDTYAVKA